MRRINLSPSGSTTTVNRTPRNPFVPATLVDLARKTGFANFILHVAPLNPDDTDELAEWNLSLLRKRQRAQQ